MHRISLNRLFIRALPHSAITIVLITLSMLLSGCVGGSDVAPIVLQVQAQDCHLSPTGTYMAVSEPYAEARFTIYDLETATVRVHPPTSSWGGLWLDDTHWFAYAPLQNSRATHGWIIDVVHSETTDILSLSPAEQTTILTEVNAYLSLHSGPLPAHGDISPDGQYEALGNSIYEAGKLGTGTSKAEFPTRRGTVGCKNGWKPDSSGYYFIERGFAVRGYPPGRIRFLPIEPSN